VPVRTDPIVPYEIPKPLGGTRLMASLSRRDAELWHALAGRVTRVLEPRLGDHLHGERASSDGRGWSPRRFRRSLRLARRRAERLVAGVPLVIRTDVTSFYPSVTPAVLAGSLRGVGAERADVRMAGDLVEGWGSDGYAGLPIGPPGSAVLADAVLRPVDRALRDLPFLRWVDDYLIGCHTEAEARRAMELLDEALAGLGLRRSEPKTLVDEAAAGIRWLGRASLRED
jgi:RNA-directed DNA polymerase